MVSRGLNYVYSKLTVVRTVTAGQPRLQELGGAVSALHHVSEGVQNSPRHEDSLHLLSLVS
jgi:hypothetical protein